MIRRDDPGFTKREMDVLKLIAEGLSTKLIAVELNIKAGTVELHRNNLIKKAGGNNMIQVAVMAIRLGWIK